MKYGAPKLEMYAAVTFVKKFHSFLALRKFILRVDNQALSWLKTYSMDENLIGRWLVVLDQYDFGVEHRPRHKHINADGMSKRSNYYRLKEELLSRQPEVRAGALTHTGPVPLRWAGALWMRNTLLITPWKMVQSRIQATVKSWTYPLLSALAVH